MLNGIKKSLKLLNNKKFSHISSRAELARNDLINAQNLVLGSGIARDDLKSLRDKADRLSKAGSLFLDQKAKCKFLKDGDKCTKFFHDLIKRNTKRNAIVAIKNRHGIITNDGEEIVQEFIDRFNLLIGSKVDRAALDLSVIDEGKKVLNTQWSSLISEVSMEEIKIALFDIDNDKAPESDGFGSLFFKSSWSIVSIDFFDAVQEFFRSGKLLKQWNHAIIALIPKSISANEVHDYRPISCCSVFYKVISKVLVNRLKPFMNVLVDKAHAAFISDRSIVDNAHLAHELLRMYARKRTPAKCTLKVDIQKAYDTVNWDFLNDVLVHLNFPRKFVDWIMERVSTTSYSISINGAILGFFKGNRGLRQGDPL